MSRRKDIDLWLKSNSPVREVKLLCIDLENSGEIAKLVGKSVNMRPYKNLHQVCQILQIVNISRRVLHMYQYDGIYSSILVFRARLADYTVVTKEGINKLQQSLAQFRSVCCNPWLNQIPCLLILETDSFARMLATSPLNSCFPRYSGAGYHEAALYIREQFERLLPNGVENSDGYTVYHPEERFYSDAGEHEYSLIINKRIGDIIGMKNRRIIRRIIKC